MRDTVNGFGRIVMTSLPSAIRTILIGRSASNSRLFRISSRGLYQMSLSVGNIGRHFQ